jgi:hypothetical protein
MAVGIGGLWETCLGAWERRRKDGEGYTYFAVIPKGKRRTRPHQSRTSLRMDSMVKVLLLQTGRTSLA